MLQSGYTGPSLEVAVREDTNLSQLVQQLIPLLTPISIQQSTLGPSQLPFVGVFHLIFTDPSEGLTMQDLASYAALTEFDYLTLPTVGQLTSQLFKQVCMS